MIRLEETMITRLRTEAEVVIDGVDMRLRDALGERNTSLPGIEPRQPAYYKASANTADVCGPDHMLEGKKNLPLAIRVIGALKSEVRPNNNEIRDHFYLRLNRIDGNESLSFS